MREERNEGNTITRGSLLVLNKRDRWQDAHERKLKMSSTTIFFDGYFGNHHLLCPQTSVKLNPISWGNTMAGGGPLREVLNRTSSSNRVKSKDASSGSEMLDALNYHMGSLPIGARWENDPGKLGAAPDFIERSGRVKTEERKKERWEERMKTRSKGDRYAKTLSK
nr:growth-regulating factor 1-like [Tanacetum cinerariifolium]